VKVFLKGKGKVLERPRKEFWTAEQMSKRNQSNWEVERSRKCKPTRTAIIN
jgi:hypothetical protein